MSGSRVRAIIEAAALGVMCGLLLWHAVSWHIGGMHERLYEDIVAGRSVIPALYNLGLILALGLVLGLLMQRITRALGYRVTRTRRFGDVEKGQG